MDYDIFVKFSVKDLIFLNGNTLFVINIKITHFISQAMHIEHLNIVIYETVLIHLLWYATNSRIFSTTSSLDMFPFITKEIVFGSSSAAGSRRS